MSNLTIVAHRGCRKPFSENTLEAFQYAIEQGCKAVEMDVRFDYLRQRFFLEHDRVRLPSLRKNLLEDIIPALPHDVTVFIELKTIGWLSDRFARHFVTTYRELFSHRPTVVISFNPFVLYYLRKLVPEIKLGFLCGNPFWLFWFKKIFWEKMKPEYFLLHKRLLNEKNVAFGKKHAMKVWAFVLNHEREWEKALRLKIDGITTDEPPTLREYISNF